jgi:hypothetical protein
MKMLNHAAPAFKPTAYFKPETKPKAETKVSSFGDSMAASLESFNLNNDFTPSTPHVHKFRTEMCKNWDLYGKCKYGDEVSQQFYLNLQISDLQISLLQIYQKLILHDQ